MDRCPRCSASLETPLGCLSCGALLPLDPAVAPDPFEILGLERSQRINLEDLRRRYLRISRWTHPDFFATAGEQEKAQAERASAALNTAFAVLADEAARADHLVRALGGPDENTERAMPQEFLMEVLDWNETLDAARRGEPVLAESLDALRRDLESRRAGSLAAVARLLDPLPERGAEALREARRGLNVVRYVDRALAELEALRLARAEAR